MNGNVSGHGNGRNGRPATAAQMRAIFAIAGGHGRPDQPLEDVLERCCRLEKPSALPVKTICPSR